MRLTSHSETGPSPFDDLILLTGESSRENASSCCITQTVNQTGTSKAKPLLNGRLMKKRQK